MLAFVLLTIAACQDAETSEVVRRWRRDLRGAEIENYKGDLDDGVTIVLRYPDGSKIAVGSADRDAFSRADRMWLEQALGFVPVVTSYKVADQARWRTMGVSIATSIALGDLGIQDTPGAPFDLLMLAQSRQRIEQAFLAIPECPESQDLSKKDWVVRACRAASVGPKVDGALAREVHARAETAHR